MRRRRPVWAPLVLGAVFTAFSLGGGPPLVGAGATFPYPLYLKWIAGFGEKFPGRTIDYRPIGSGAGIEALRRGDVDFAATDAPLSEQQIAAFPQKVRQIPTVVGGVVPIYHVDGEVRDLRLTPEMLTGIYLGRITRWNDPRLKAAGGGIALPGREITVVHRSDSSGTTYVWTDYLSKVSPEWQSSVGSATEVAWPAGVGAVGNEGVAARVGETRDSIGYVEFIYALRQHLSYGAVRNASGRFVYADLDSLPAAAKGFSFMPLRPGELRASITNARDARAYPIAAFTYFIVPETFADMAKARLMSQFLQWTLTVGQKESAALGYAALPGPVAKQALESAGGLKWRAQAD
jgi:phosphate transport system substrate-binding protein